MENSGPNRIGICKVAKSTVSFIGHSRGGVIDLMTTLVIGHLGIQIVICALCVYRSGSLEVES